MTGRDPGSARVAVRRTAGRVLVVDEAGRVLLLHGHDPARPAEPYWFTAGGGVKPGETVTEAAARELREETGIAVPAEALGEPVWHEVAEFSFDGTRFRQEQDFFLLRVETAAVTGGGVGDEEAAVIDGHRWWTVAEIEATAEAIYPAVLLQLLSELTAT